MASFSQKRTALFLYSIISILNQVHIFNNGHEWSKCLQNLLVCPLKQIFLQQEIWQHLFYPLMSVCMFLWHCSCSFSAYRASPHYRSFLLCLEFKYKPSIIDWLIDWFFTNNVSVEFVISFFFLTVLCLTTIMKKTVLLITIMKLTIRFMCRL